MNCACPDTLLLARRLAIVASIPETGAWIIVDGSSTASLYLDLIQAHRGKEVCKGVRFAVAYSEEAARRARHEVRGLPVVWDPIFVERYPEELPPAAAKPGPWQKPEVAEAGPEQARYVALIGKPEHVELVLDLMRYGFALGDLAGLDLESLERLLVQAEIVDALASARAA